MSLVKELSPALKELFHPSLYNNDASVERCFSVGRGGIAGRLYGHLLSCGENIDSHDSGVKVTANRLSRQCIYIESSALLPLTACYQLYLQPVGRLEGFLRKDTISVNKKHPSYHSYIFVTDSWLTEQQIKAIALV